MNNNRGNNNNNRRRGRGNNRQGGGGGQQLNRVDSRARGNAPQLLEKYRKLAHDAHLNGDRVTEEYNLQFAEHYFRVIADQRLRQEEQRGGRRDERFEGEGGERGESDDAGEYGEGEYQPYDQSAYQRRDREERPRREERGDRPERSERPERAERQDRPERQDRNANRAERSEKGETPGDDDQAPATEQAPDLAAEQTGEQTFEPAENPFVRGSRGLKPRREDRRPRRAESAPAEGNEAEPRGEGDPEGSSLSLPPAISAREKPQAAAEGDGEPEAKPRRRAPRKPKPTADGGEALEAVS